MDVQDRLDDCVSLEPVYNTANQRLTLGITDC